MANDLAVDIRYVDTAADIFADAVPLGRLVWTNMSSGDDLIIKDVSGGVFLFHAKASINNDYVEFNFDGYPSKLRVDTIDGGLVLFYPYQGT